MAKARFVVACDVDNPLLGPSGAAAVYGAQKGAGPEDMAVLDAALAHWADVVADRIGADVRTAAGAGAAGGVGFAALAVLGADMRPGIELMLDLVGFDEHLPGSALVVTGEGSLDEQSLRGKAPVGVAAGRRPPAFRWWRCAVVGSSAPTPCRLPASGRRTPCSTTSPTPRSACASRPAAGAAGSNDRAGPPALTRLGAASAAAVP